MEDFAYLGPTNLLALGDIQTEFQDSPNKRGRKRKHPLPQPELQQQQPQLQQLQPQQLQFDQMSFTDNVMRDVPQQEQSALNEIPGTINATQETLNHQTLNDDLTVNESLMPPPPSMTQDFHQQHIHTPGHESPHPMLSQTSANFDDILRCEGANLGGFTPMTPSTLPNIPMTPGALNLQDDFLSGGVQHHEPGTGLMEQLNDDDYHQDHQDHLDHHDHHDQINTSGENEFNDFDEYPVPEAVSITIFIYFI